MKFKNPIKELRERKAEEKRRQEEEKRRQEAEEKKKRKRLLIISAGVLAALLLIGGIGSLFEKPDSTIPDTSSQVESLVSSSTADLSTESEETPSSDTKKPSETDKPSETVKPSETDKPDDSSKPTDSEPPTPPNVAPVIDLSSIPAYSDEPYVVVNNNVPGFTDEDLTTTSFEFYSSLDSLGRCGVAYACVGQDIMPTEERGSIGQVKPTGWHTVKYDIVDGKYLYNRCHLIGYQLSAENANTKNLITGTRYMNVQGMLPFENMVADYVKETNNHVLYRVTPLFDGNNLLAAGVLMEALSVEDNGDGVCYNVFVYNVQPGISIDYATGDSSLLDQGGGSQGEDDNKNDEPQNSTTQTYILNTNTHKFHLPSCSSVGQMSEKNKQEFTGSREEVIAQGYEPCKKCNP